MIRERPPYYVLVSSVECAELFKEFLEGRVGRTRLEKECGKGFKSRSFYKEFWLVDIVVGLGSVRDGSLQASLSRPRRRLSRMKCVKMPAPLAESLERLAARHGLSFGEAVRRLLGILVENGLADRLLGDRGE